MAAVRAPHVDLDAFGALAIGPWLRHLDLWDDVAGRVDDDVFALVQIQGAEDRPGADGHVLNDGLVDLHRHHLGHRSGDAHAAHRHVDVVDGGPVLLGVDLVGQRIGHEVGGVRLLMVDVVDREDDDAVDAHRIVGAADVAQDALDVVVDDDRVEVRRLFDVGFDLFPGQVLKSRAVEVHPGQRQRRQVLGVHDVARRRHDGRCGAPTVTVRLQLHQLVEVGGGDHQLTLVVAVRCVFAEDLLDSVHGHDQVGDVLAFDAVVAGDGPDDLALTHRHRRRDAVELRCVQQAPIAVALHLGQEELQGRDVVDLPVDGADHERCLVLDEAPDGLRLDVVGLRQSAVRRQFAPDGHDSVVGPVGNHDVAELAVGVDVEADHQVRLQVATDDFVEAVGVLPRVDDVVGRQFEVALVLLDDFVDGDLPTDDLSMNRFATTHDTGSDCQILSPSFRFMIYASSCRSGE